MLTAMPINFVFSKCLMSVLKISTSITEPFLSFILTSQL